MLYSSLSFCVRPEINFILCYGNCLLLIVSYASDPTIALRVDSFAWCEAIDFTSTQVVSATAVVRTPTWDFHLVLSMAKAPLRVRAAFPIAQMLFRFRFFSELFFVLFTIQ